MMEEIKRPIYVGDRVRFNYILKYLPKITKGKLLDCGAGQGEYKELAELKGYKYTGIDTEPRADFVTKADVCELPFNNNEFDVVISVDLLEHVKDHHKAVKEMSRVLKPDGLIIIHFPNKHQKHILIEQPEEHPDHIREGYDPVEINTLMYDFKNVVHYKTFDILEAITWDLVHAITNNLKIYPYNILDYKEMDNENRNYINYGWIVMGKKQ